jgi:type IV pilus assembly protein PilE
MGARTGEPFLLNEADSMKYTGRPQQGFTLIELMIAVLIIAVIAAIAIPNYTRYVQRGYRSEGLAMLNDIAARMERFYAQNNSYAGATLQTIGLANANVASINSTTGRYVLSLTPAPTAVTYTVLATASGPQASDACGNLTVTQDGTRASSTGAADCFR